MSEFTDTLARDIDALKQVRDELRVQLHLAKAEAKDRWDKLEEKWHEVEARSSGVARESAQKIATATQELVDELKREYQDLKSTL